MAEITDRDREVFNNLDELDESHEGDYMDVDVFFDLMEEMVDKYYDEKEKMNK